MINIGRYNKLTILRDTNIGLFLGDKDGNEVLLPNKYCPIDFKIGDILEVFVYLDRTNRKIATNLTPKIVLNGFAYLRVETVTDAGAFLDWGMEKHLYVPKREQRLDMYQGEYYFVYMLQDETTEKLYASSKVERYLNNENLTIKEKDSVDLLIYQDAGFGYSAIINNKHKGMIYKNETFKELEPGNKLKGYVKLVRDDNKVDISLQPIGYRNFSDPNNQLVLEELKRCNGYLSLNDKSRPEDIYDLLGISKKSFKKAIGALYKQRLIEILPDAIKLVSNEQ